MVVLLVLPLSLYLLRRLLTLLFANVFLGPNLIVLMGIDFRFDW
jgi:hypothetical protein